MTGHSVKFADLYPVQYSLGIWLASISLALAGCASPSTPTYLTLPQPPAEEVGLTACQTTRPPTVKVIGLWPDDPPLTYQPFDFWSGGNYYIWPVLDSPQPTLRWEPFPRPGDITVDTCHVLA